MERLSVRKKLIFKLLICLNSPGKDLWNTILLQNYKPNSTTSSKLAPAGSNAIYTLQAGAFTKQQEADALKAKLILDGLDTSIQKFDNSQGQSFYRVIVGPVTSQEKLAQAKTVLAQHNINPIVLQQKK